MHRNDGQTVKRPVLAKGGAYLRRFKPFRGLVRKGFQLDKRPVRESKQGQWLAVFRAAKMSSSRRVVCFG